MKCTVILNPNREEEILIYAHERSRLIEQIEQMASPKWVGYREQVSVVLNPADVDCFIVEDGKIQAVTNEGKFHVRARLYQLEEKLSDSFVKINQSCLANMNRIARFEVSFGASLTVIFKNGYRDFVSRRQVKQVKERLGIK